MHFKLALKTFPKYQKFGKIQLIALIVHQLYPCCCSREQWLIGMETCVHVWQDSKHELAPIIWFDWHRCTFEM